MRAPYGAHGVPYWYTATREHTEEYEARNALLWSAACAFPPVGSSARALSRPHVLLQGLELLVTVLLARNRLPPPTVAAGLPHADFAAELLTLPSGLLAMVCEAIVKLQVPLGPACVRACRARAMGEGRTRSRHVHCAFHRGVGAVLEVVRPYAEYYCTATTSRMLFRPPIWPRE